MKRSLLPFVVAPLMLLAACEEEQAEDIDTSATGGEAAGEVLGGSISDDMIALEQLRSTSPPAERPGGTGPQAASPGDDNADEGEPQAPQTQEAEAPSEAPAPDADDAD